MPRLMDGGPVPESMAPEAGPAKPLPPQFITDLSEAIDALLGIIAMVQEEGLLDREAMAALDELAKAAEKAVTALDRVVSGSSPKVEGEEFKPASPVLSVPIGRGHALGGVVRARTPSFGLESE